MKISARNVLKGTVKKVEHGEINTEVVLELPDGQEVVAVITEHSAKKLGIAVGKEVFAVIKASDVMLIAV
jgi:molybdopterin-binding protein